MNKDKRNQSNSSGPFESVGRDSRIDLSLYTVTFHEREVIDYEKLKSEDPKLYEEILKAEEEQDRLNNIG